MLEHMLWVLTACAVYGAVLAAYGRTVAMIPLVGVLVAVVQMVWYARKHMTYRGEFALMWCALSVLATTLIAWGSTTDKLESYSVYIPITLIITNLIVTYFLLRGQVNKSYGTIVSGFIPLMIPVLIFFCAIVLAIVSALPHDTVYEFDFLYRSSSPH